MILTALTEKNTPNNITHKRTDNMPDPYGLYDQDANGTYLEGPLEGQTRVTVLINADATRYLQHASREIGYAFDDLVRISAEEAALNHARQNNLT